METTTTSKARNLSDLANVEIWKARRLETRAETTPGGQTKRDCLAQAAQHRARAEQLFALANAATLVAA